MTQQVRRISRAASTVMVDNAIVDVLKILYDGTKRELPNAHMVTLTLYEYYDDGLPDETGKDAS